MPTWGLKLGLPSARRGRSAFPRRASWHCKRWTRALFFYPPQPIDTAVDVTKCAFWEYASDSLQGHWATHGCKTLHVNSNATTCSCNHLTHFAILMSSGRANVSRPTLQQRCVNERQKCCLALGRRLLAADRSFRKCLIIFLYFTYISLPRHVLGAHRQIVLKWINTWNEYSNTNKLKIITICDVKLFKIDLREKKKLLRCSCLSNSTSNFH